MKNLTLYFAFYFLSVFACLGAKDPGYDEMAAVIRAQVINILAKKYKMNPSSTYGELFECVNALGANFQIRRPLTKEEARIILVDCTETFLDKINNDVKIRPFLKNYPFTSENIQITIFIKDKQGYTIYDPLIGMASQEKGTIIYTTLKKKKDFYEYYKEIKEPFDEAVNLINMNK